MTMGDFTAITSTIERAYPNSRLFSDDAAVAIWYLSLQDLDAEALKKAVIEYIKTNTFPPSIADLRRLCPEMATGIPSLSDAAEEADELVRNYGYYQKSAALEAASPFLQLIFRYTDYGAYCKANTETAAKRFKSAYDSAKRIAISEPQALIEQPKQQQLTERLTKEMAMNG